MSDNVIAIAMSATISCCYVYNVIVLPIDSLTNAAPQQGHAHVNARMVDD